MQTFTVAKTWKRLKPENYAEMLKTVSKLIDDEKRKLLDRLGKQNYLGAVPMDAIQAERDRLNPKEEQKP
jgi:hypothetical protein